MPVLVTVFCTVLLCRKENKIRIHPSSVLCGPPDQILSAQSRHQKIVAKLPTDWLLYEEMTRTHLLSQIKSCTAISAVTVALFAGPGKVANDTVKTVEESAHLRAPFPGRISDVLS